MNRRRLLGNILGLCGGLLGVKSTYGLCRDTNQPRLVVYHKKFINQTIDCTNILFLYCTFEHCTPYGKAWGLISCHISEPQAPFKLIDHVETGE